MKTKNTTMNTLPLATGYRSTMRGLIAGIILIVAALAVSMLSSCGTSGLRIPSLPIDLGVRYEVEPGIFIVASPADKGGLDLTVEGDGQLSEHVRHEGDAWIITSPNTGIVYRITRGPTGRPKIEIVGGGNGKLQLVPKTPPAEEPEPTLTEPAKGLDAPAPVAKTVT
jgi:hypothetical protein